MYLSANKNYVCYWKQNRSTLSHSEQIHDYMSLKKIIIISNEKGLMEFFDGFLKHADCSMEHVTRDTSLSPRNVP